MRKPAILAGAMQVVAAAGRLVTAAATQAAGRPARSSSKQRTWM